MANKTLQALREIGVLDELGEVSGQVMCYPGAVVSEPDFKRSIGISAVWFNWYRAWQQTNGQSLTDKPGDVPKERADWAKAQVAQLSSSTFQNMPLLVRRGQIAGQNGEESRLIAYTANDNIFGIISRDSEKTITEGPIQLGFVIAKDGNMRAIWQAVEPPK
jgi:hypothetical protein